MLGTFIADMSVIYPDGVPPAQHRDLVRAYYMGWHRALQRSGSTTALESFRGLYAAEIEASDFVPGEKWFWWKPGQESERQDVAKAVIA